MIEMPQCLIAEIVDHAKRSPDAEVAGIVVGDDRPLSVYRLSNISPTPKDNFDVDHDEILALAHVLDDVKMREIFTYHSHVDSPGIPSAKDLDNPPGLYGIVSLLTPRLRLWHIADGQATEIAIQREEAS